MNEDGKEKWLHPWGNQDTPVQQLVAWYGAMEGTFHNLKTGVIPETKFIEETEKLLKRGKCIIRCAVAAEQKETS